ncbi:MAG TPA: 23S rRNA (uracil(1939)-C(5))-methyltransferase RlmD [Steroidobacteraceae bacterium]|nr:23S rRNA (uracil(1939)-C(5))-methyltransferase RlmD [Steroidobacteraceae bacterium]
MARARVAVSEIVTARVDGLNHDGWGVVRGAGKAVFVAGALPGELVEYRTRRRQRSHDEAELVAVLEPAPDRITPGCAHYGTCGGCSLQHLAPESQLKMKDAQLREALRRIGKVEPLEWLPPLSGDPWGYRRRARLGARFVHARGRSLVGFREKMSSYVAEVEQCPVLRPEVGRLIGELSRLVTSLSIPARIPQIEAAIGDALTVLVVRVLEPPSAADRALLEAFERQHGLRILLQAGRPDQLEALSGDAPSLWYGLPEYDLKLAFQPADFIQVNGAMNRLLIQHVLGLLELDAQSVVLDLFCGLGNFTLPLATRAQRVVGIEGDAGLIARAQANAAANGLGNVHFHVANLAGEEAVQRCLALAGGAGYSHVLVDPPRTGALDVLPALARLAPRRLAYVSCHPGSLARDLGILVTEHGFSLRSAGIVDMFPHTSHVESVAILDGPDHS